MGVPPYHHTFIDGIFPNHLLLGTLIDGDLQLLLLFPTIIIVITIVVMIVTIVINVIVIIYIKCSKPPNKQECGLSQFSCASVSPYFLIGNNFGISQRALQQGPMKNTVK